MAILVSTSSGNWSSSSTWNVVDTTSYMATFTGDTTIGASSTSQTFIPGAITITGICIYLASRTASPSGTLTVALFNSTAGALVAGASVTTNVSDFPNTTTVGSSIIGWTFFKFPSPVTLLAATSYSIRVSTSVSNQMSAWRDSVSSNWVRALVTTTTGSPAAGDSLIVVGEYTSSTITNYTVTMDNTNSSTTYVNVWTGPGGNLNYGNSASTNYFLRITGALVIGGLSNMSIGTASNPIQSTSTATLEFNLATFSAAFQNYAGTFNAYGSTLSYVGAKLASDVAVGASTSITDVSTGWKVNDRILVTTTATTTTQQELRTITAISGVTISHATYSFAHGGNSTTLYQADIVNLTRNVKIFSTSQTNRAHIFSVGYATNSVANINLSYVELYDLGGTTTTTGGIQVQNYSNVFMTGCSMYLNTTSSNINLVNYNPTSVAVAGYLNVYDSIFYNAGASITYNNNIAGFTILSNVYSIQNAFGISIIGMSTGTFSNLTIAGCSTRGIIIGAASTVSSYGQLISNSNIYGNGVGIVFNGFYAADLTIDTCRFWRNTTPITNSNANTIPRNRFSIISINNSYIFSNTNSINIYAQGRTVFNNCIFWAGTSPTMTYAINLSAAFVSLVDALVFNSCIFGRDYLGNNSNFSTAVVGTIYTNASAVSFLGCTFSGTESANQGGGSNLGIVSTYAPYGYVSLNHNGVSGSHKVFTNIGTITTDTAIFRNLIPSIRLTPVNASFKLRTNMFRVPTKSNQSCTISVWVRKSINNNLITYSETYTDSSWNKGTPSVSLSSGTLDTLDPIGTYTATKVTENASSSAQLLVWGSAAITAGQYTISIYAKAGERSLMRLSFSNAGGANGAYAFFNLSTGVASGLVTSNVTSATASVSTVGNGWYRCSVSCVFPSNTTLNQNGINIRIAENLSNYAGTTGFGIYVWGAQLNAGPIDTYYSTGLASSETNYNGSQPRLVYVFNPFANNNSETVGMTATTSNGVWERLTYTTPISSYSTTCEFYVDCDGTTGWVNVDDWSTTTYNDSKGGEFWSNVGQYTEPSFRLPGGNYTFIS